MRTTSTIAQLRPVDMFVMLDRSGSMNNPCGTTSCEGTPGNPQSLGDCNVGDGKTSKWCLAINGLASYFKSSEASGNAAALQVFGPENVTACTDPAFGAAAIGDASGYRALPTDGFDGDLSRFIPQGSTPTVPAAKGISTYTLNHRRAGRITIGVLVTDGDPSAECFDNNYPPTLDGQVQAMSDSFQANYANNGIFTFTIGMTGATFDNIEKMAQGGNAPPHGDIVGSITDACGNGVGPCRHFNVGDGHQLAEAMKQIQRLAAGCRYDIPRPSDAGPISAGDITVQYLPQGVPPATTLTHVIDASSCIADGWFYDDNAAPALIQLCPSQCTAVQADVNAKISVQLACLGG